MKPKIRQSFFLCSLVLFMLASLNDLGAQGVLSRMKKRVENKVRDRIEKKVNEAVDKNVDKALDQTEEAIEKGVKPKKSVSLDELLKESDSNTATGEKPKVNNAVFSSAGDAFYPMKEGARLEYSIYDAKDKLSGSMQQELVQVKKTAKGKALRVQSRYMDANGKELSSGELLMRFENNIFYADIRSFLDPNTMKGLGNMDVEISGTDLLFPAQMQVGQGLPDAKLLIVINEESGLMPDMELLVQNRKVLAKERVTTEAGSFEAYKISSKMQLKSVISVTVDVVQWMAPNIGVVRSESYDKKGRLTAKMILTKYKD